ncbi:MAG: acetate--CoA ligase family protein [Pseudomonadota bacterium]
MGRLLRPRSIAVVGGGAWCTSVIRQAEQMGFDGAIWPVHPSAMEIAGHGAFPTIEDLPAAPDACFVGVNRQATVDVVGALAQIGAGGAVCFASGFAEARGEDAASADLQAALVAAAGDMPILGPNCYGFINALDAALLWPDQHGCVPVARGVAILTQSSNIAINLTMQQRGLPIAYTVTCGNMAQTSQAQIALALLEDTRVTAIGLHIEGFGDIAAWEALAARAPARGVAVGALNVGGADQARAATVSHTASLAGSDAGAQALLERLGFARVRALTDFLETLKLLHCAGPLGGNRLASISCSGGEASLIADMALAHGLQFPALDAGQQTALRNALGPMVALSNPLDYHTYIWRDTAAMTQVWSAMTGPGIDLTLSVVDYPRTDPTDWRCTVEAALATRAQTDRPFAVVASLPELMPADIAAELMEGGVVPMCGLSEALVAADAAARIGAPHVNALWPAPEIAAGAVITEARAKARLASVGLYVPRHRSVAVDEVAQAATGFDGPLAIKGEGLAHKTEAGAVRLGVAPGDAADVARRMGTETVLIEEMIGGAVVELLVGVTRDPAHGFVLTLGAGGVWTEVMRDTVSLLLPATEADITAALNRLRIAPVLAGYRGQPAASQDAIVAAVTTLQRFVAAHRDQVNEVEINPLICTPTRAIAVDALLQMSAED